ncbi:hypothetical protein CL652_03230 [bacterium]|nr:hypothetical protein [bacterium]|tara:strand:- start:16531 stop:17037 length:507 start_codon:yes stop_codon:yes gene_type:complete
MDILNKPLVILSLIVLAGAVAVFVVVDEMPQEPSSVGSPTETVNGDPTVRNDGDDFEGLAVFPTWSALEPATFPVSIEGEARGMWYFEASFPIKIVLPNGVVLGKGYAQAQEDWMTEEVVPFSAEVALAEGAPEYVGTAALVLEKANPSGLPENAAQFTTTITVDTTQ